MYARPMRRARWAWASSPASRPGSGSFSAPASRSASTTGSPDVAPSPCRLSLFEVAEQLRSGAADPLELTAAAFERTARADARLNCGAGEPWTARANVSAAASDVRRRSPDPAQSGRSPLDGVPIAIKDNFCVEGEVTTAASRILGSWRPPYTASSVEALEERGGAVLTGKLNMDEFGMGSGNLYSRYGPVVNPWSLGVDR